MTGFANVSEYAALAERSAVYSTWRKSPSQITPTGIWFDLSMSPGNPVPQYYAAAPLRNTPLFGQPIYDGGLFHGIVDSIEPDKWIQSITAMTTTATALPMAMMLCDYQSYYPFIDEGTLDPQTMDNSSGLYCRDSYDADTFIMAVSVAGRSGGQQFNVTYIGTDGYSHTTGLVTQNSVSVTGNIVTSDRSGVAGARGPFLPKDPITYQSVAPFGVTSAGHGIRYIESVTMATPDVGLFALVIVKPIALLQIRGVDAPVEYEYLTDTGRPPKIHPLAYLNLLALPMGSLAATAIHGDITTLVNL